MMINNIKQFLVLSALCPVSAFVSQRAVVRGRTQNSFYKDYKDGSVEADFGASNNEEDSPFGLDDKYEGDIPSAWGMIKPEKLLIEDPSALEIEDSKPYEEEIMDKEEMEAAGAYPISLMMQDCAPFIASHAGETVVFHMPGEILADSKKSQQLLSDIVIAYLLGMKIVMVVGTTSDSDSCSLDFKRPHECHNALKVVNEKSLRAFEEEAGFLRTEIERKINRCMHQQGNGHKLEGNVVSGNFFTARHYGRIRGQDFEYAGYVSEVHTDNIENVLKNGDIILLSTLGLCRSGDLASVNGYHLAASVAASLKAHKIVFLANEGSILHKKGGGQDDIVQGLPLSFAEEIIDYYGVKVHSKGFANFDDARNDLAPRGVELLLHLGWSSWALENGVTRAHIVNPTDGALLEELFTTKNGANTCLFHDDEVDDGDDVVDDDEWDNFFQSAKASSSKLTKNGVVARFG
mmetsp:Transcript_3903/g.7766  ORF Transcript_3903/g.7766 Transcript_3903/m.7766 type:complete len:462 (-) Transcript_3903:123-1508(-)